MTRRSGASIRVGGKRIRIPDPGTVLYPKAGLTRAGVVEYYRRIAPALLPHLENRPVVFQGGPEESMPAATPPRWLHTARLWSEMRCEEVAYCCIDDGPGLVWAVTYGLPELRVPLGRIPHLQRPTSVFFDLDAGSPAGMAACCQAALLLRELFERLDLRCFVKTSGSEGLHVHVPVDGRVTYQHTRPFARAVSELLERRRPELCVAASDPPARRGRVFIDWSQNDEERSTAVAYTLRARDRPTVSTPLFWEEVDAGARGARLVFEVDEVLGRLENLGDPFVDLPGIEQELPYLIGDEEEVGVPRPMAGAEGKESG